MKRVLLLLMAASIVSVFVAASAPESILAGDAVHYQQRMEELFAGRIPYFEFAFEHQPLMIIPMAAAWLVGGFRDEPTYIITFALISFVCFAISAGVLKQVEQEVAVGIADRFVYQAIPLLPLLLFRNDSFAVVLAVTALAAAVGESRSRLVGFGTAGILAKIWPAVLIPLALKLRWRAAALRLGLITAAAVAINFSPVVQSIQEFSGLHTESLAGSIIGSVRSVAGVDLEITRTATAYISAPAGAMFINFVVGAAIGLCALRAMLRSTNWSEIWSALGGLVGAGLLASPYLSPQYIAWLLPFSAISWRRAAFGSILSGVTLVTSLGWFEQFGGSLWWWSLILVRNLALAILAWLLTRGVKSPKGKPMTTR